MKIITDYLNYLKDNPQRYWFKRKLYGWGWTPAKAEGWLTLGLYVIGILYFVSTALEEVLYGEVLSRVVVPIIILTLLLILICYLKGETPRWQWGLPKEEDKS